ncbi:hypothetical protein [Nonlabens sp.]|uniref:hypothetical protein n=1 Tax=Nonlabens sp. TaxID=1888209 RepID=UPI001BCD1B03|nr:hypothetical protein [Nonlabens sp.]
MVKIKSSSNTDKKKQSTIVETLEELKENCIEIEINYKKKLEDLEDLKKSILQKAFAGELTKQLIIENV